ncbi:hypothetical protein P3X46_031537 [Hevea brasiliensis]|uniref:Early nodulin-93-like n=1 Tax=Hevea brasiliensis TaxID=3981 RepID=A0ABQ9KKM3_HEVBR|nr:hypothetical protein P3X46_031537 [Hevea brasiliensis]
MAKNVAAQSTLINESDSAALSSLDQKPAMAKRCSHGMPLICSLIMYVRMLPWARANINPTGQALIISSVAGAAYFVVADKTVLATARKNSFNKQSKV